MFKNRLVFCLLAFILVLSLLFVACSTKTSTQAPAAPAPSTSSAAQPAPAAPASQPETKVIEIKAAFTVPPVAPKGKFQLEWINKIMEATQGRVKITPYWSASALGQKEILRGTQSGLVDIASLFPSNESGALPLSQFAYLTMMGYPNAVKSTAIFNEIWNKYPQIQKEWDGTKMVYPYFFGGNCWVSSTKKQVLSINDLKGMKFTHTGGYTLKYISALGAAPVQVSFGEQYSALEKGLVEAGFSSGFGAAEAQGILDLYQYHLELGTPVQMGFEVIIANPDFWNKLPADIQKIIMDLYPWYVETLDQTEMSGDTRIVNTLTQKGKVFTKLNPAELPAWQEKAKGIQDEWVKNNEAKGSAQIYQDLVDLIAKSK